MPSQQQIDRFTLAFHRVAVNRLREEPELRLRALQEIDRWEAQGLSSHAQPYRDRWRALLSGDTPIVQVSAWARRRAAKAGVQP